MSNPLENKRAGREKELKDKLKAAVERFEAVFGRVLDTKTLLEFLHYEEAANKFNFLRDRIGSSLSDVDIGFLRKLISFTKSAPELAVVTPVNKDENKSLGALNENLPEVDDDSDEDENPDFAA